MKIINSVYYLISYKYFFYLFFHKNINFFWCPKLTSTTFITNEGPRGLYLFFDGKLIKFNTIGIKQIINFLINFNFKNFNSFFLIKNLILSLKNISDYLTISHFGFWEIELKGLNYWFTLKNNSLIFDLGKSHFLVFFFSKKIYFIKAKKKKMKKILLFSFCKFFYKNLLTYLRFTLKPVGPYKLKGFQFLNERFPLKEGKKPFK